jgi:hypothetical protein
MRGLTPAEEEGLRLYAQRGDGPWHPQESPPLSPNNPVIKIRAAMVRDGRITMQVEEYGGKHWKIPRITARGRLALYCHDVVTGKITIGV